MPVAGASITFWIASSTVSWVTGGPVSASLPIERFSTVGSSTDDGVAGSVTSEERGFDGESAFSISDTNSAFPPLFLLFCGGGGLITIWLGRMRPLALKTTSRQRLQSSSSSCGRNVEHCRCLIEY